MTHHTDTRRPSRHLFYASPGRFSSTLLLSTFFLGACDATSRPGDTLGLQTSARWEWHARLVVERDPTLTLVRLRIDTTQGGGDVGLASYDFNPSAAEGDEYELTLGLDFGRVRDLRQDVPYTDRKSTRLNSSHLVISYAVFCLKKKKIKATNKEDTITRIRHSIS